MIGRLLFFRYHCGIPASAAQSKGFTLNCRISLCSRTVSLPRHMGGSLKLVSPPFGAAGVVPDASATATAPGPAAYYVGTISAISSAPARARPPAFHWPHLATLCDDEKVCVRRIMWPAAEEERVDLPF